MLEAGAVPPALPQVEFGSASLNATGGGAPTQQDLSKWRSGVVDRLSELTTGSKDDNDRHSLALGQALAEVVNPSPSDAAHDGVWAYLTLMLFPDVVQRRWPLSTPPASSDNDRWVGALLSRDRNYLKLSWRRWTVLGSVVGDADRPLGEDEYGALLERTSIARNFRLVRLAAQSILENHGAGRSEFARRLMKEITLLTGPLHLDVLSDSQLKAIVQDTAHRVNAPRAE